MVDLLIRGMELPSCCYECPCVTTVDIGVGIAYGCVSLKAMMYDPSDRLDECPLVEIPDHGRLIDADSLVTMAREYGYELVSVDRIIAAQTIIPASKEGGE